MNLKYLQILKEPFFLYNIHSHTFLHRTLLRRICCYIIFLPLSRPERLLGPTQPPIQRLPGALCLGVKRPGREADHSPPSTTEVKAWMELYVHSLSTPSWSGAQLKEAQGPFFPHPMRCFYTVFTTHDIPLFKLHTIWSFKSHSFKYGARHRNWRLLESLKVRGVFAQGWSTLKTSC
jgi:hypothetical protein